MKPYLSIVIPHYNAPDKVEALLASIKKSKGAPPFEVIVVDDGSVPPLSFSRRRESDFRSGMTKLIHITHNKGPAVARNRGAGVARGKFLVFLDCDVEVFPDTFANIAKIYEDDPDVVALTGVWVRHQKSRDFFPNFKALRDWSYWIHERDKSGYYFLFSTRIASIKKSVFQRLGGFDESYPAPLIEDIELTYRIARRYAIIFAPNVRVRHEFEGFWPIAKKYFWRTYYWARLYRSRKKFDPVATTLWETVTAVTGVGALGLVVLGFVFAGFSILSAYQPVVLRQLSLLSYQASAVLLLLHIFMLRTFLLFVLREKGFVFACKSLFVGLVLYMFILAGACYFQIHKPR